MSFFLIKDGVCETTVKLFDEVLGKEIETVVRAATMRAELIGHLKPCMTEIY